MVLTVSFVLSPVIGLCCHRHRRDTPANLTPASRRQNHTTSPSASCAVRQRHVSVHRIPSRVRDDREPPLLVGRDGGAYNFDLGKAGTEMFLQTGLDSPNQMYRWCVPSRQEGRFAIVTNAGRDAVDAAVSNDERCWLRTAKSCGPDAPTLASSSSSDRRATVATTPGHWGEHEGNR